MVRGRIGDTANVQTSGQAAVNLQPAADATVGANRFRVRHELTMGTALNHLKLNA